MGVSFSSGVSFKFINHNLVERISRFEQENLPIPTYLGLLVLISIMAACASEPKQQTTEEVIRKTTTTTESQ